MKKAHPIELALLAFMAFYFVIGVYTGVANTEYFETVLVMEDGVVEWLTVSALLMCAGVTGARFLQLRGSRTPLFLGVLAFLTVLFVFGAMEEISWGQRILGIESSEYILENNAQGETNLHNMVVGDTKINRIISRLLGGTIITYIVIFPLLYWKLAWIRNLASQFAVPVPRTLHIVSYLVVGASYPVLAEFTTKKGELLEFCGCMLFLVILAFPKNAELYDPEYQPQKEQA